mmetsp:Transcript_46540/g.109501  ORF Transcript_46540/g.109501 Transcript_46540/m.109501 type:complete len:179 (+) Transcript_46540:645-1181(+)
MLDTSTDLERAVKDLSQAAKLAPDDKIIAARLRTVREEHAQQRSRDASTFGGMFNRGDIYTEQDIEQLKTAQPKVEDQEQAAQYLKQWELETKRQAKEAGVDLDEPETRKLFERAAKMKNQPPPSTMERLKQSTVDFLLVVLSPNAMKAFYAFLGGWLVWRVYVLFTTPLPVSHQGDL